MSERQTKAGNQENLKQNKDLNSKLKIKNAHADPWEMLNTRSCDF